MESSYSNNPTGMPPGTDLPMYYWLSIPEGQRASDYNSSIAIKAVKAGEGV